MHALTAPPEYDHFGEWLSQLVCDDCNLSIRIAASKVTTVARAHWVAAHSLDGKYGVAWDADAEEIYIFARP